MRISHSRFYNYSFVDSNFWRQPTFSDYFACSCVCYNSELLSLIGALVSRKHTSSPFHRTCWACWEDLLAGVDASIAQPEDDISLIFGHRPIWLKNALRLLGWEATRGATSARLLSRGRVEEENNLTKTVTVYQFLFTVCTSSRLNKILLWNVKEIVFSENLS